MSLTMQQAPLQPPPHPFQQQQHPHKRRRPRERGKKAKRAKRAQETTSLGFFGNVPSLQELQLQNQKATRRYFQGPRPNRRGSNQDNNAWRRGGPTPKTVPPAPDHPLFRYAESDPLLTPAVHAAGPGGEQQPVVDKLAADGLNAAALDMFGTNEGLLFQQDSPSSSDLSEGELGSDGEEVGTLDGAAVHIPRHIRARLEQQDAIIAELEDENLRLRERFDMMQQEIDELRHLGHRRADSDGALDSEAEEVASAMPHPEPRSPPAAAD